mgnify:CR=1 FL=1
MKKQTRSQRMAQAAFTVANGKDYKGFAREFPTLVHSCGLAQAFVFAKAKKQTTYREGLTQVLRAAGCTGAETDSALEREICEKLTVPQYLRLSRDALAAAVWIKRFCEADKKEDQPHAE